MLKKVLKDVEQGLYCPGNGPVRKKINGKF